jgi:hypothetical protein
VRLADTGGLTVVQRPSFRSYCELVAIEQKAPEAPLISAEK